MIKKVSMRRTGKTLYISLASFWAVLFISITVSMPAQAQAGNQWARYSGKDEEFSVLLPERPAAHSKLRPKLASEQRPPSGTDYERGRIYGAYADGIVYVIMSFDRVGKEKLDDFIEEFQKYHRPVSGMMFVRDVTRDDISGKQYRIKLSGVEGVTYFYLTRKHIYVLQAAGDDENNPAVRRFLTSFTLNGKALVNDIAGDSGEAQSSTKLVVSSSVSQPSTSDEVFSSKEVTRKAIVVMRPEPQYRDQARMSNATGKIVIRAVLSSSGQVDGIKIVESMPNGMTEGAVEALRNLKFIPAIKDGKFVSQYVQVEYHFGSY